MYVRFEIAAQAFMSFWKGALDGSVSGAAKLHSIEHSLSQNKTKTVPSSEREVSCSFLVAVLSVSWQSHSCLCRQRKHGPDHDVFARDGDARGRPCVLIGKSIDDHVRELIRYGICHLFATPINSVDWSASELTQNSSQCNAAKRQRQAENVRY
eukprot:COSAG06_NODE_333_length_17341_cov_7.601032_22_plen_154_part_00